MQQAAALASNGLFVSAKRVGGDYFVQGPLALTDTPAAAALQAF